MTRWSFELGCEPVMERPFRARIALGEADIERRGKTATDALGSLMRAAEGLDDPQLRARVLRAIRMGLGREALPV